MVAKESSGSQTVRVAKDSHSSQTESGEPNRVRVTKQSQGSQTESG
jgi:hypothetical protein